MVIHGTVERANHLLDLIKINATMRHCWCEMLTLLLYIPIECCRCYGSFGTGASGENIQYGGLRIANQQLQGNNGRRDE